MPGERICMVVPCYNEEIALPLFIDKMQEVRKNLQDKLGLGLEYIFVDDGSTDGTSVFLKRYCAEDPNAHYIRLSRNFGKEAAIYAGLRASKADLTGLIDCDLQDPPELLVEMAEAILREGYDCGAARRVSRTGEPVVRSLFAKCFYRFMDIFTNTAIPDGARDFRLMNRNMCDAVLRLCEYNRFSKGIFSWVGFDTKWIAYENRQRVAGSTKWSFRKLSRYAFDGIIGFTVRPLEIAAWAGVFFFVLSFVGILFVVIRKILFGDPVAGWPSMVCIILFCSGVQLFCTGIIGEYLAKTYVEVKRRPICIIKETDIKDFKL